VGASGESTQPFCACAGTVSNRIAMTANGMHRMIFKANSPLFTYG